ncbi:hypothetical protein BC830DRAFT_1162989 [Chytriomyces sp. MP71]|nr:hypothetical protein BC830DRAFT_1162989 [Chytriomyces sp. MP71]
MKESDLVRHLSSARDSLEAATEEVETAGTLFFAPKHSDAVASASSLLEVSLVSLAKARVNTTSKCPLQHCEPILDNPFFLCALALLLKARLKHIQNEFSDSLALLEQAASVFPFSARVWSALGNARRIAASSHTHLNNTEHAFKEAIKVADKLRSQLDEKLSRSKGRARQQNQVTHGHVERDEDDEDNEGEEEDDWLLDPNIESEINAGTDAANALILLLLQNDRPHDASPLLASQGYKFRLSDNVLAYNFSIPHGPWRLHDIPFVKAVDNALPPSALTYLQTAFAPSSVFWREHFYGPDTPYFSYTHPLAAPSPRSSAMDQLLQYLHSLASRLFPRVQYAQAAEWWVHTRAHSAGHQLHFDSAHEGAHSNSKKRKRKAPVHPIASCVVYLSEDVGGPTLVTNQRLGDPLADRGWMVESRLNRVVMFDGSVLHGVVPGRGYCERGAREDARRTSFMVAFWEEEDIQASQDNTPGSARPFPYESEHYTWSALHAAKTPEHWPGPVPDELQYVIPMPLDKVWEAIPETQSGEEGASTMTGGKEAVSLEEISEETLELRYSRSKLGLPNYNLVFQGF